MNDSDRELIILQLADKMSSREEWCGAAYLQALTYLLDSSDPNGCGFAHFWYRGGPYSSFVAETLEKLRAEGALSYAPVVLAAGPSYQCTPAGKARLLSRAGTEGSRVLDAFLNHPGNQRLLLARAAFALVHHQDQATAWLEATGADPEQARESLRVAEGILPLVAANR